MSLRIESIQKIVILLYIFMALWPLRISGGGGGSIAVVHIGYMLIIAFIFMIVKYKHLVISTDFDSKLLFLMLAYMTVNTLVHGVFDSENILTQQRSLIAMLVIMLPFYLSRNMLAHVDFSTVLKISQYGGSLLLFYWAVSYGLSEIGSAGRMLNQRDGVLVFYIMLMSSLFMTQSRLLSLKGLFYMLSYFTAIIFMTLSFSKGAYLLLFITLPFLFMFGGFNIKFKLIFIVIPIALFMILIEYSVDLQTVLNKMEVLVNLYNRHDDGSTIQRLGVWSWVMNHVLDGVLPFLFGTSNSIHVYDVIPEGYIHYVRTSESQYVDVILRNGFIGLTLQLVIMFRAVYIAYRMSCVDVNNRMHYKYFMTYLFGVSIFCIFEPSLKSPEFGIFFYFMYGILVKNYNRKLSL